MTRPSTVALLAGVAGHQLAGAAPLPPTNIDDDAAAWLLDRARAERIVGLLDEAVATGVLTLSPAAARRIGDAAAEVAGGCLLVERHTLLVHATLADAGIAHRLLKGVSAAHRFGGRPHQRSFADVDLLVPGPELDRAVSVLESLGHVRTQPEWRPGFAARFGKSVTLRSRADNLGVAIEVDLHRTLASGPYGLTGDPAVLWQRPAATVAVGGVELPCLDPAAAFVHACVHAVTGQRATLASLRDVARLLSHVETGDVDSVAATLGTTACVTAAVGRSIERLSLGPDPRRDAIATRPIGRRDRAWLARYTAGAHRFRTLALTGVTAVPTVRGKLAYAWALARP